MENEKKVDLFEILNEENLEQNQEVDGVSSVDMILKTIDGLNSSLGALHVKLNMITMHTNVLSGRVANSENMLAFLLEKDPEMGPKLKAEADKISQIKEEEKAE